MLQQEIEQPQKRLLLVIQSHIVTAQLNIIIYGVLNQRHRGVIIKDM